MVTIKLLVINPQIITENLWEKYYIFYPISFILCSIHVHTHVLHYTDHGILQARILEWVACPFSSRSSWPRNLTRVSCIAGRLFTNWVIREAQLSLPFPIRKSKYYWTVCYSRFPATELSRKQCEEDIWTTASSSLNNMWWTLLDISGCGGSGTTFLKIIRCRWSLYNRLPQRSCHSGIHVTAEMALGDLQRLTGHEGKLTAYSEWEETSTVFDNSWRKSSRWLAPRAMDGSSDQNPVGRQLLGRSRLVRRRVI